MEVFYLGYLSIILFSLIFSNDLGLILLNLSIYNIILRFVSKGIIEDINNVFPYIIGAISIVEIPSTNLILTVGIYISLAINFILIKSDTLNTSSKYLFNIFLFVSIIKFVDCLNFDISLKLGLLLLFLIAIYMIEYVLLGKDHKLRITGSNIIAIILSLEYIIAIFNEMNEIGFITIIVDIIILIHLYNNFKEYKIYKILAYILQYFALFTFGRIVLLSFNLMAVIPLIISLEISIIERKSENIGIRIINLISQIVAYISISVIQGSLVVISNLLFTIYLVVYNYKLNNNYSIIPLTGLLIINTIYNYELNVIIKAIAIIILSAMSIKDKKISVYTIFSGIFLYSIMLNINNDYISTILLIIWGVVQAYFMQDEKARDKFKIIISIGSLILYYLLIEDLFINDMTIINMLGVICFAIFIIRKIIIKYTKNVDTLEGIVFIGLYLFSFSQYKNEIDGIIFIFLIIGIVALSYYKGYGTLFMCSILAILLNSIVLTREFWLSIPWWLYLLVIGSTLIGLAIKNESDENKKKFNLKDTYDNIKNKIEKNK